MAAAPKDMADSSSPAPQMVALSVDQFREILGSMGAHPPADANADFSTLLQAVKTMAEGQLAATQSLGDQVKRTTRFSNADHEHVSVFAYKPDCAYCTTRTRHPDDPTVDGSGRMGHPRPLLAFETWFPSNCKIVADDATVLEIELFNLLGAAGPRTAREGLFSSTISPNGKRLIISVHGGVYTADERNSLPPLPQILLELLSGSEAADPLTAIARIATLETRLRQMEAAMAPVAVSA